MPSGCKDATDPKTMFLHAGKHIDQVCRILTSTALPIARADVFHDRTYVRMQIYKKRAKLLEKHSKSNRKHLISWNSVVQGTAKVQHLNYNYS